ncbi:MAG TPA: hypothetical protein VG839_07145, partial [Asticcacaulis sp.]|nr:hypothetical protein [Asticcacaulis sp.]
MIQITTHKRFFAPVLLAAGLALAAVPALLPVAADAQVLADSPAKVQAVETILGNLKVYDVLVHVGQKSLLESPDAANYTPAQKAQLSQLFASAMAKRRTVLVHKLAMSCRSDYTLDQLNNLTQLSKIKYIQDLVAQGGDPSLIADAGSLTVADQDVVQTVGNAPYASDFFNQALDY